MKAIEFKKQIGEVYMLRRPADLADVEPRLKLDLELANAYGLRTLWLELNVFEELDILWLKSSQSCACVVEVPLQWTRLPQWSGLVSILSPKVSIVFRVLPKDRNLLQSTELLKALSELPTSNFYFSHWIDATEFDTDTLNYFLSLSVLDEFVRSRSFMYVNCKLGARYFEKDFRNLSRCLQRLVWQRPFKSKAPLPVCPSAAARSCEDGHPLHREVLALHQDKYGPESTLPKLSIVIPAFNRREQVIKVLGSLQNQISDNFEVLLVDDGSSDQLRDCVNANFKETSMSLRYFYLPRSDSSFRAGIARLYGSARARGELLAFLDADILVPSNFVETVITQLKNCDLVQCRRHYLKAGVDRLDRSQCWQVEDGYWDTFYQSKNWNLLEHKWKYVCTYALAMQKANFFEWRGFARNFLRYGFEDTLLGLEASDAGAKFKLADIDTYHLHSDGIEMESNRSLKLRRELLRHSAAVFYLNALSEEALKGVDWIFYGQKKSKYLEATQ